MLNRLRDRLLFSYVAVIAVALLLVAAALLAISLSDRVRLLPALQQLRAISVGAQQVLDDLDPQQLDRARLQQVLERTAANHDVRILLVNRRARTIVYDTGRSDSWEEVPFREIQRLNRLFPELNPDLPVGRYEGPDGSRWVVFSQALPGRDPGRLLVVYAAPEPRPITFFRDTFLPPLWRAGLVALLLGIALAFLISHSVSRPLQEMAGATEAVAAGDYDQQLPLHGPEEVQRVARSFNSMAAQVKATQQAQRDFLANVSHDLKTPLTAIQGWSQALADGTATDPEQQATAARIIREEATRMTRMVSELLDLARIESGELALQRAWVDLGALLRDVERALAWLAQERGVALTLDVAPVPPVWGDPDRLMQVFTNLVANGLDHTPAGGRVHVTLRQHGDAGVEITVQDTGRGIPPEDVERIFERFYQVEKSRARPEGDRERARGFGLGLAISRELVHAHGGRISVQSRVGEGSRFTVRLPTTDAPVADTAPGVPAG